MSIFFDILKTLTAIVVGYKIIQAIDRVSNLLVTLTHSTEVQEHIPENKRPIVGQTGYVFLPPDDDNEEELRLARAKELRKKHETKTD